MCLTSVECSVILWREDDADVEVVPDVVAHMVRAAQQQWQRDGSFPRGRGADHVHALPTRGLVLLGEVVQAPVGLVGHLAADLDRRVALSGTGLAHVAGGHAAGLITVAPEFTCKT